MRTKSARSHFCTLCRLDWLLKDPPQLQLFIVTDRRQYLAVRAEARMQYSLLVSFDLRHLCARGMRPDVEQTFAGLCCTETVGGDDLTIVWCPVKRGDLSARGDGHGSRILCCVPEVNVPIAGASACCKKAQVVRAPCQGLCKSLCEKERSKRC